MVGEISSVLRELEKVQDRLSSLTQDAQSERHALMTKQEELRTKAARLADDVDSECSTHQLLSQLARLRRRREVLNRQRRSVGPGGYGPGSAGGLSQVEDRIQRIRSLLADRGIRVR